MLRDPTVVAAIIAALISLASIGLSAWITGKVAEKGVALTQAQKLLEFKNQQFSELYAPLLALIETSEAVYVRLVEVLPYDIPKENFRLLDHLPSLCEHPVAGPLVNEVLSLGEQMKNLLTSKGGMVYKSPWPDSFKEYLAHYHVMVAASHGANPSPGKEGAQKHYYPREFNKDVRDGHTSLLTDIQSLGDKINTFSNEKWYSFRRIRI